MRFTSITTVCDFLLSQYPLIFAVRFILHKAVLASVVILPIIISLKASDKPLRFYIRFDADGAILMINELTSEKYGGRLAGSQGGSRIYCIDRRQGDY